MTMICFDVESGRFNYRVAGVILHEDRILLNCLDGYTYWFLPGGRVEMGEPSAEALRREMQEELQEEAQVGQLLWIAENFFVGQDTKVYHELGLYYRVHFVPEAPIYSIQGPLSMSDGHTQLTFRWFSLSELEQITLHPSFLIQGLRNLPEQTVHILEERSL